MQDLIHSSNAFVIDDPEVLNALLAAIWTLKYDTNPEDVQIFVSSPLVSEIVNRASDCLTALYLEQGRVMQANELIESRRIEKSSFQKNVLPTHVQSIRNLWSKWSEGQRMEYVRLFMAPTIMTDAEVLSILVSLRF